LTLSEKGKEQSVAGVFSRQTRANSGKGHRARLIESFCLGQRGVYREKTVQRKEGKGDGGDHYNQKQTMTRSTFAPPGKGRKKRISLGRGDRPNVLIRKIRKKRWHNTGRSVYTDRPGGGNKEIRKMTPWYFQRERGIKEGLHCVWVSWGGGGKGPKEIRKRNQGGGRLGTSTRETVFPL